jgi:hypothetical protein
MLSLVPKLHDLVGTTASRNMAQLRELGVKPTGRSVTVTVAVAPSPTPGQQLLASTLIDLLLRLDPLVTEVIIDAPDMDEGALAADLAIRLPVNTASVGRRAGYVIGIGPVTETDLLVNAAGWVAALGEAADTADGDNPIGPLGVLAGGELIKEAMGAGQLRGSFDHVFRFGPNPDMRGTPAIRPDCLVDCSRQSKLAQYQEKYGTTR